MSRRCSLIAVAMGHALLVSLPVANAQVGQSEQRAGAAAAMLEEVLITAQKKAEMESAQVVPISVTAFSAEQMEAAKVQQISDVGFRVPNAVLNPQGSVPNTIQFSIRGQGSGSSIPSDDPAVGVFVDGVFLGMVNGANLNTFDLESIEVLRGPQGTLFGRNVSSGAVLLRTARPSFDSSTTLRATAGSDGRLDGAIRTTGGLVEDKLAGKLSILYTSTDGYFRNINDTPPVSPILGINVHTSRDYGESEALVVRPALRFTPSDRLTIDFIAEYTDISGDGDVALKGIANIQGNAGLPDLNDNQELSHTNNGDNELEAQSFTVDATYETARGAWTSVTGYRSVEQRTLVDSDGSSVDLFQFLAAPENSQFSQELRWAGTPFGNESIELTAGAYYFTQDVDYLEGRFLLGSLTQGLGGEVDHESWAAFSAMSWHINDALVLNVGARYTDESKKTKQTTGSSGCDPVAKACTFTFFGSKSWSNLGGNAGLQYFSSDRTQWYATWSRGFRSGGFNLRNTNPAVFPGYDEETVDAFEVGVKSDISSNLRLNLAIWNNDYEDLQRVVIQADASQAVRNAAKASVKGVDVELSWLVTDLFSLSATYGYMDGKYEQLHPGTLEGFNNSRAALGMAPLRIGQFQLDDAPENTGSLIATLDQPLGNNGTLTYRAIARYMDKFPVNDANTHWSESYTAVDANITYTSPTQKWEVTLWGKNITDETMIIGGGAISLFQWYTILPGSRYGLDVQYRF